MSKMRDKVNRIRGGGGGSADFLKVSQTGKYELRLYRYRDADDDLVLFHDYEQHRTGPRSTHVCLKSITGDPSAPCGTCEETGQLYDEGTKEAKEAAGKIRAKTRCWFLALDIKGNAGGSTEKFGIVEFSGYGSEQIMHKIAMVGGWTGDWSPDDDECLDCLEEGLEIVCGPNGRNLKIDASSQRRPVDYYRFAFPRAQGKALDLTEEDSPDLPAMWRKIKSKQENWDTGSGNTSGTGEETTKTTRGTPSVKKRPPAKKKASKRKAAPKKAPAKRKTTKRRK